MCPGGWPRGARLPITFSLTAAAQTATILLAQVSHSVSVHGGSTAAAEAARRAAREVKRAHTM